LSDPDSVGKKQLRGEALKRRIECLLRAIIYDPDNIGRRSSVSLTKLARQVPCSKTTIYKYQDYIEHVLNDSLFRIERRTGKISTDNLIDLVGRQSKEIEKLKDELAAMHAHHRELYSRLLRSSVELSALVEEQAMVTASTTGRCVFCGEVGKEIGARNVYQFKP